ncbi:serine/threonine-protein kinase [Streptomyces sp. MAR4 CNX-425]|uniref:serine/threonine-protein kinase n=1 Tax=Streptomyces sp. MAR4 CNX-425 TaxID=3406343 RepID=UPI003B510892
MRSGDIFAERYVLKEVLGTGRGGDVWRAADTVLGQDVALKPERAGGPGGTAVRQLLGEPRAMAKFRDHPHVVTLFDVVPAEPDESGARAFWFVMEYVPGGGLDRRPRFSPEQAARIGAQLAAALAALHEAGIVHCDVKPANIGLTRQGDAKLLDFGAVHRTGGTETITLEGPVSYTPDYAAPEVARGNHPQPASDVFCLAATLHALVTGAPPRGGTCRADAVSAGTGDEADPEDAGEQGEWLRYWKAERGVVELDPAVGLLAPVLAAMLRRDFRQRPDAAEAGRLLAAVAAPGQGTSGDAAPEAGAAGGTAAADTVPGDTILEDTVPQDTAPGGTAAGDTAPGGGPAGGTATTGTGAPRRRWRLPLAAAALGAVALLALAFLVVPGHDDAGSTPRGDDAKSASNALIADPHTADVCAMADPAAFGQFGAEDVRVDVDYGNFDQCDVLLEIDEETRIDVSLSLREGTPPEGAEPSRTIGRIDIHREEPESDECTLLLSSDTATGGGLVGVRVNMGKGTVVGGAATLCTVADRAAESAAEVLDRGPLPRRQPAYPSRSLAWADACRLLDARALSAVSGLKDDVPSTGVANWSCEWANDDGGLDVKIAFFRDQPKSGEDAVTTVRPSGYRTVVEPDDDGATCSAFVEYRRYSGQGAETAAEMVRLDVGGRPPTEKLCEMAEDLASSAAAELRAR